MYPKQLSNAEIEAAGARAVREKDEVLLALASEALYHRRKRKDGVIYAESGVSLGTGKPFVRVSWDEQEAQLDPSIAKGLGQSVIDAAYSAEHDAFFCAYLVAHVGLSQEQAAHALGDLRAMRAREEDRRPS